MSLAIPLTLTRRALRGAAYPSWSLSFEMQHELGRTLLRNHHSFSLADLCQLSADFASDPPAGQCSVRGAYCAGIKADIIQHRSSKAASSQQNLAHNQKKSHHTQKNQIGDRRDLSSSPDFQMSMNSWMKKMKREISKNEESKEQKHKKQQQKRTRQRSLMTSSAPSLPTMLRLKQRQRDVDSSMTMKQLMNSADVDSGTTTTTSTTASAGESESGVATVLYLHGGGFCVGSATTYRRCLWHFSREMEGLRFLAVDYSLSPRVRFPVALRECLTAYLWLIDENGGNVPADQVVLAGDSAGGCLALALLFLLREMRYEAGQRSEQTRHHSRHPADASCSPSFADRQNVDEPQDDDEAGHVDDRKEDKLSNQEEQEEKETTRIKLPFELPSRKAPPPMPRCAFLISPWVDLSEASSVMKPDSYTDPSSAHAQMSLAQRFIDAYLGTGASKENRDDKEEAKDEEEVTSQGSPDIRSPFISPLYGDMHGLPPIMLTAGSEEPLLGDIQALYDKCLEAGVQVELDVAQHMDHAYQVFHEPAAHHEIKRSLHALSRFVWSHLPKRRHDSEKATSSPPLTTVGATVTVQSPE